MGIDGDAAIAPLCSVTFEFKNTCDGIDQISPLSPPLAYSPDRYRRHHACPPRRRKHRARTRLCHGREQLRLRRHGVGAGRTALTRRGIRKATACASTRPARKRSTSTRMCGARLWAHPSNCSRRFTTSRRPSRRRSPRRAALKPNRYETHDYSCAGRRGVRVPLPARIAARGADSLLGCAGSGTPPAQNFDQLDTATASYRIRGAPIGGARSTHLDRPCGTGQLSARRL